MADHHSRYCLGDDSHVVAVGDHVQAFVSLLVVEPFFFARVYQATWDPTDVEMRELTQRASGNHA